MRPSILLAITLAACGPKHAVVTWARTSTGMTERIELQSSGDGQYTSTVNGVEDKNERVVLSGDQIDELAELFKTKRVCELTHDPSYTPSPEEGQTSLELAFPDQRCKVVLSTYEWQQGRAKDIAETMQSMRPLRPLKPGRVH